MRTAAIIIPISAVIFFACQLDNLHHDLPAPINFSISLTTSSAEHKITLTWDSTGPFESQVWRSTDGLTFSSVADSSKSFRYVDSGDGTIDSALYLLRFVLPPNHHSAFAGPVFGIQRSYIPDPNAGVFSSDGTSLSCH